MLKLFRWRILCLCLIIFCVQLLLFNLQTSGKLRLGYQEELSTEFKVVLDGHSGFENNVSNVEKHIDEQTNIVISDNRDQLVDLYNFTFTLNTNICDKVEKLLVISIVSSALNNFEKRDAIRKTWGKPTEYLKLVFMTGETKDKDLTNKIIEEHIKYGDIVQGNFIDAYRNMTYKHVMALQWVGEYCSVAKFILKTDDDMFVHRYKLKDFVQSQLRSNNLVSCMVLYKAPVIRDKSSKWYASETEFAGEYYPPYCLGPFILYRTDVATRLVEASKKERYFYIDDVFVTGILTKKLNIRLTGIGDLYLDNTRLATLLHNGTFDADKFLIGPLNVNTNNLMILWNITEEYRKLQQTIADKMGVKLEDMTAIKKESP